MNKTPMTMFRVIVLSIVVALFCTGCGLKKHKNYAFSEPEFSLVSGSFHAKLRGRMLRVDDVTSVNGAPYEMLLWFKLNSTSHVDGCSISFTEMALKNTETGNLVSIPKTATASFRQRADSSFVARISVKNLHLLYSDHEMEFVYSFNDRCGSIELSSSITMKFSKNYSEREISFWDILMGV